MTARGLCWYAHCVFKQLYMLHGTHDAVVSHRLSDTQAVGTNSNVTQAVEGCGGWWGGAKRRNTCEFVGEGNVHKAPRMDFGG